MLRHGTIHVYAFPPSASLSSYHLSQVPREKQHHLNNIITESYITDQFRQQQTSYNGVYTIQVISQFR